MSGVRIKECTFQKLDEHSSNPPILYYGIKVSSLLRIPAFMFGSTFNMFYLISSHLQARIAAHDVGVIGSSSSWRVEPPRT